MLQSRSIFNEIPRYDIEKNSQNNAFHFKVTFNMLTINYDYEQYATFFALGPINQVDFKILNDHRLMISVTHSDQFSPKADKAFRAALGVASRHNLYSKEVDAIVQCYQQSLAAHGFDLPVPQSQIRP